MHPLLETIRALRSSQDLPERIRFVDAVARAVLEGIYPAQSKIGLSALKMVEGYGALWHVWDGTMRCPHCGVDLRDHTAGPPFKREIGCSCPFRDKIVAWECPDCGGQWPRG